MSAYQPIDTIPLDEWVEVVTATDKVCVAKVACVTVGTRWIKRADGRYPRRIYCRKQGGGDVWARAWRPLTAMVKAIRGWA